MIKFILIFLLSFNCLAQDINAVRLEKGKTAPFTGILITDDKAKELDKAERSNIVLRDLRLADKELIEHYKSVAKDSQNKLTKARIEAYWGGTLGFVLGVAISCFAFKVVQESSR